jgi:hypothetical protein
MAAAREEVEARGALDAMGVTGFVSGSSRFGFAPDGGKSGSCSFGIEQVLPQSMSSVKVVDEHRRLVYTVLENIQPKRAEEDQDG